MKINELVNEAMPYGFGSYLKNQIRSSIPFGAKGQAQAMGKNQAGMRANQEYQRFYQWLGSFNGQATMPNLLHFLKGRRFDAASIEAKNPTFPKDRVLTDKEIALIITTLIQRKSAPNQPVAAPATTPPVPTPPPTTPPATPPVTTPPPSTAPKPKYKMGPDGKPVAIT
jgi:hypothetical protein